MRFLRFLLVVLCFGFLPMQTCMAKPPAEKIIQVLYTSNTSFLTIKILQSNSGIVKFEIANLIGRPVKQKLYEGPDERIVINDINDLPNGIYIILAKDKNGKILDSAKFILNNQ